MILLAALAATFAVGLVHRQPTLVFPLAVGFYCLAASLSPSKIAIVLVAIALIGLVFTLVDASVKVSVPPWACIWSLSLAGFGCVQMATYADGHEVLARYTATFAGILIAYVVWCNFSGSGHSVGTLWVFAWVAFMEGLLGLAQFLLKSPVVPSRLTGPDAVSAASEIPGMFRAVGTLAHPNAYGIVMVLSIPFLLLMYSGARNAVERLAIVCMVLTVTLAALASLSRGVALALLAGVALWWSMGRVARPGRARTIGFMWLGAGVVLVLTGPFARFGASSSSVSARDAGSNMARVANMRAAVRVWQDSPFFGKGFGTGSRYGRSYGGYEGLGAHNTYLDVLSGGGLILASLLAVFFVLAWIRATQSIRSGSYIAPLIATISVLGLFESLLQSGLLVLVATSVSLLFVDSRDRAVKQLHEVSS